MTSAELQAAILATQKQILNTQCRRCAKETCSAIWRGSDANYGLLNEKN